MKGQKKKHSFLETCLSTAIGYGIALATQIVVFPWFNIEVSHSQHLTIGLIFTVVSVVRGYFVRRLFNLIHLKGWL